MVAMEGEATRAASPVAAKASAVVGDTVAAVVITMGTVVNTLPAALAQRVRATARAGRRARSNRSEEEGAQDVQHQGLDLVVG